MTEYPMDQIMSPERRRSEVHRKLTTGTGEKMTANRSQAAREILAEAWTLASMEPRIYSPMYEACAYRMANVLFRSATSRDQLIAVDGFYQLAIGDEPTRLGPMPLIQRVAVLKRLASLSGTSPAERQQLERECRETYDLACQAVRTSAWGQRPCSLTGGGIQGALHNLLELTAYYTGYEYEGRIEGTVSPYEDLALGDEWTIFGTGQVDDRVRLPYELARIELQQREQQGLQMAFELPGNARRGGFPVWTPTRRNLKGGRRALLMLATLCSKPRTDREIVREVFHDTDPGEGALRDVRRELRELLEAVFGEPGLALLPKTGPGEALALRDDLRIAGMVAVDAWRPRRGLR